MLLIGFGLAIASSPALNAGYLLQHIGGGSAPAVDVRAPVSTVRGLWPPVIVTLCAAAFFALQRSLQLGTAATVIVLMTSATNVVAVVAGVSLFAESFGARLEIAWLHGPAMLAIAGASWRLVAVQARIGERGRAAVPYRGLPTTAEAAA